MVVKGLGRFFIMGKNIVLSVNCGIVGWTKNSLLVWHQYGDVGVYAVKPTGCGMVNDH